MVRPKRPPSPTWRAFLTNHLKELVSADFFVVPTIGFKVLFVFVVLAHARRRIVHFNVTEHPTAQWTAHQISEAFPWEAAPRYLLRDRDAVYGDTFRARVERMGIEEVLTAPRSPWQNQGHGLRRTALAEAPRRILRTRALGADWRSLPRSPSPGLCPHRLPAGPVTFSGSVLSLRFSRPRVATSIGAVSFAAPPDLQGQNDLDSCGRLHGPGQARRISPVAVGGPSNHGAT